ncbi:MAG: hypothetical protein M0Q19_09940 [Candidatus Cloacimonetes bacterium]|jgi:type II restriction enzyme|nr:hypothetical protein [Candidatus Cloacimonadota bacterium]MCK9333472.1 hypothetical protein [Candidatus Cloacimonadota bacterium]MDD4035317.1 EcoRI family type II restriction endonuclease [Candidatus Cloacimonadota bacterium]
MSDKHLLRITRENTVINKTSKNQENELNLAIQRVFNDIKSKHGVKLVHSNKWFLADIVNVLKDRFPNIEWYNQFTSSSMKPDGGIMFLKDKYDNSYPILISEVKNQGTNDLRMQEGKKKQAQGNAVERLGKNVIGFKTAIMHESIFPFVCFGYGCDFAEDCSIIDRVVTIAMFSKLNVIRLHDEGSSPKITRGSFFFREKKWTESEMYDVMFTIADRSVLYYFSKYGEMDFK